MSFVSVEFLLFLAAVFGLYFIAPKKVRPYVLLAASLYFYARFSTEAFFYLGFSVLVTFCFARLISRAETKRGKQVYLTVSLLLNLGLLFACKFLNYSLALASSLLKTSISPVPLLVPLGIAFYSMQAASYLIDVYRAKYAPEKNPFRFLAYMTYFPIIMQGPISRYDALSPALWEGHAFDFTRFKSGTLLMLFGFFKKMVIADRAALLVNTVFDRYTDYTGLEIVLAVLLYTVQIYTDFSGCVDISRGMSEVLGIPLADNFRRPYFAASTQDFWRRWHISLSSWFRDYLYIPLGGNRKGTLRKYSNLILVFFASGLWHGVGFHFLVWGLLQAAFQIAGALTLPLRDRIFSRLGVTPDSLCRRLSKWLCTLSLSCLSWLFFRANGFLAALKMIKSAVLGFNPWIFTQSRLFELGLDAKDLNVLLFSLALLFCISLYQERRGSVRAALEGQSALLRYPVYLAAVFFILVFGIYGPGYSEAQFLYMQF